MARVRFRRICSRLLLLFYNLGRCNGCTLYRSWQPETGGSGRRGNPAPANSVCGSSAVKQVGSWHNSRVYLRGMARRIGMKHTFAVSIGGAAGQGVATPGNIFARIFARRGLHVLAYNAYQSIIRGGHTFLTIRTGPQEVLSFGDKIHLLIPLNQDTMDR